MSCLIFVSDSKHLNSDAQGGVQNCTSEFIRLFKDGGYDVQCVSVEHSRTVATRVRLKLGIDIYGRYDAHSILALVTAAVEKCDSSVVAINQVDLARLARPLKAKFGESLKIVVLSHGNESGDFLHSLFLKRQGLIHRVRDIIRLGYVIHQESQFFRNEIDGLMVISELEESIGNWLGAKDIFFVPRLFNPQFLEWQPVDNRVGFLGTLDHAPNYHGVRMLLDSLDKFDQENKIRVRVAGRPDRIGDALASRYSRVEYLGYLNNDDLNAEMSSWSYFLNPVFWYSRGASTKLAMGIDLGIPVITTKAGRRGYRWSNGNLLECSDSPDAMASTLMENLTADVVHAWMEQTRIVALNGPKPNELAMDARGFLESL